MLSSPRRRASAGPTPSTRASKGQTPLSVKVALKRAPFILFAKDVPDHLPAYDPARDFNYYFANDMMSLWTGLSPAELTSGHNAASAFFDNYERLFQADVEVALDYHFPLVKTIIEGWQPPIMSSYVNMRKTLVDHGSMRWVIGCGAPFDDLEIGVASFRASKLPPPFQPLGTVPDEFYNSAYAELPQACFMLANMESPFILGANEYAHALQHESGTDMANVSEQRDPRTSRVSSGASACPRTHSDHPRPPPPRRPRSAPQWSREMGCPWDDKSCTADMGDSPLTKLIERCLAKVRTSPQAEVWQFGSVRLGDQLMRVWVWKPLVSEPTLAFSLRPHLETLPDEIKQRLLVSRNELPELKSKPTMPQH